MADNNQNNNKTDSFDKGINSDIKDYHSSNREWTFARNSIPNSRSGDWGDIGAEPANALSVKAPYTIIGFIYLFGDTWAVFSTDDTNSEIGRFVESTSTYTTVVNDSNSPRLKFNRANLIIGQSKENFDCSWHIYWSDGNNPDRTMNFDAPPFLQTCSIPLGASCEVCVPVLIGGRPVIDIDAIRLAKLVNAPCLHVIKGATGGNLPNGSYFVVPRYLVNGQPVTDFFTPSNVQPIFEHSNVAGSIDVVIDSMDLRFDEFELVVVSIVNQQTSAKHFGIYNTRQKQITIDIIDPKLVDVPIAQIPVHNPIADKSDGMYSVGNYLLRVGPTNKFDFNYQPLANQIVVKWQSVEYPADYYRKGGSNTSRLRDENYAEFIQWIYDDGDLSSSYHIPGRPALPSDLTPVGGTDAQIEISEGIIPLNWMVYNTAGGVSIYPPNTLAPDGVGVLLSEGIMGYWESTELYPDDKPLVYNASTYGAFVPPYAGTGTSDYDLCGKPIRHHKMPEQSVHPTVEHFIGSSANFNNQPAIRIIGTKYENIKQPVDNAGVPIPGIVGYRILRGSREGNKTIVAKGMLNNMFPYNIPGTTKQGLYPNFPYNDLGPDDYISQIDTLEFQANTIGIPNTFRNDPVVTFHSPDTSFSKPFLSMKELKVYGRFSGTVKGEFVEPDKHPKHKFVSDAAFVVSVVAGIGIAAISMNGKRTTTHLMPRKTDFIDAGFVAGADNGTSGLLNPLVITNLGLADGANAGLVATLSGENAAFWSAGGQLLENLAGGGANTPIVGYFGAIAASGLLADNLPGMSGYMQNLEQESGAYDNIPSPLLVAAGGLVVPFAYFWSQGTDATLDIIRALIKWEQHALQYQSHCFYDTGWQNEVSGNTRRLITDELYLDGQLQDLGPVYRINNLFRGQTVAVQTAAPFAILAGDDSKQTIRTAVNSGKLGSYSHSDVQGSFTTTAVSYYGALKNRIQNQYGQIGGVHQIPITSCTLETTTSTFPVTSPVIFGGDTYVTRYTEKNTMFFFYDWLYGQPDGYEFNYHLKKNVLFPKYWMDTQRFDVSDFMQSIAQNPLTPGSWVVPSSLHAFDRNGISGFFGVHDAYVYLFNSGVRDFYVESDVNTDLRDWGDTLNQRYYDPYRFTDEKAIFDANPDIIKSGNYFKYDYSLSISKLFTQFISWANIQPINYDPAVYASCFVHNPNLVIYSLPSTDLTSQQAQLIRDNWTVYLANNYKYFQTPVSSIKPINKSGAIFFFGTQAPQQMMGVESLRLGSGVDVTVGTGALFSQPLQNLITAENAYEYGSCQNRLSVASTPMGLFWISQTSGKIFQLQGGIQEISMTDLKWWFAQYLPYMLTQSFPDFELQDNPVIGIGCQTIFDNENTLVYFMKRDFKLKDGFVAVPKNSLVNYHPNTVQYTGVDNFLVGGLLPIKLGDPVYFEDASWCAQYDPKTKAWIGYQDWIAELTMPGKNTFLTTKTDSSGQCGIWLHNSRFDLYCNYYGVDAPFEVEFRMTTGQQVNTIKSVELQMENYLYASNGHDRYLMLEYFFDKAVVHNAEQCSGLLKFAPIAHNDPWRDLSFPAFNLGSVDILYSKVENKYRFNMFFDLTDDRGEFTNARRMIWNTAANGYVRTLNNSNLNYAKDATQRKRFRDYNNLVFLRKDVVGNIKILLMLSTLKLQQSPR